ncbi:hypothetical protein C1752_03794 [Acaryochloris thomasi RCC1774]|uniref:Uncharacterized protein n=1 Tax=Acaryochloris thomasi RCC1774 TaxID=1764569 RepID=A0A2W1JF12_9CYAN|nr:hypothetical protein [Acaryochloris thomasi]PZD72208.1 hypothetical protein C1752_03794 [Acaryochloris thomasi RCC1774]
MIRNIFYFGLGAVAASFITHAGVPLWTHFSQVINWNVAEEAAQDVGEVISREAEAKKTRNN